MLLAWMLYAVALASLLAAAAAAVERLLRLWHRQARGVWAAAIALAVALPLALALAPARGAPAAASVQAGTRTRVPVASLYDGLSRDLALGGVRAPSPAAIERGVWVAWGLASLALVAFLAGTAWALALRRGGWRACRIDEHDVLVSPDLGPAVVGVRAMRIVVPAWALELEPRLRAHLLAHEAEHVRARDPLLLAAAWGAAVLMPWNVALWYHVRRLRLAVELDCDARVLARTRDARGYGSLLLLVGERIGRTPAVAAAAFAEPVSFLERRIHAMLDTRVRHRLLRAAPLAGAAIALVALACETPRPAPLAPSDARVAEGTLTESGLVEKKIAGAEWERIASKHFARQLLAAHYPDVLKGQGPESPVLWVVVDARDKVVSHELVGQPPAGQKIAFRGGPAIFRADSATGTATLEVRAPRIDVTPASIRLLKPEQIEAIEITKFPADVLGPAVVSVATIRLKATTTY